LASESSPVNGSSIEQTIAASAPVSERPVLEHLRDTTPPKQHNLSAIPDAAIIIVTYNFSDSPGQRCESIEFFGFR
jgi:hypothetical protein